MVFTKGKVGGKKHDAFDPYEYLGVNEKDSFIDIIQAFGGKVLKDQPHLSPDDFEANKRFGKVFKAFALMRKAA